MAAVLGKTGTKADIFRKYLEQDTKREQVMSIIHVYSTCTVICTMYVYVSCTSESDPCTYEVTKAVAKKAQKLHNWENHFHWYSLSAVHIYNHRWPKF